MLTRLIVMWTLIVIGAVGFSGCGEEDSSSDASSGRGDQEAVCERTAESCPNACEQGSGILGESCNDTDSCSCGLFCDAGRCLPYRGEYQGCRCPGEAPPSPEFTEQCNAETEGAPCNDLNPCTIDDYCAQGRCVGSPTPYPAACDDGNSCTSGDVCAGAVCQGVEKADGARCDDGMRCTEVDQCLAGQCIGSAVDCSQATSQCTLGLCDPQTGECVTQPKPTGTSCDDGNYCTLNERCEAGACLATQQVDCNDSSTACLSATCDPLSGACLLAKRPDGLFCDLDESACTQEECQDGECVTQYTVQCENLCNDGLCDPATGRCIGQPLPDGTACDDADACTENSECRGGACFITALLCACDDLGEGDLCDDGDPCTLESRCDAEGSCIAQGFAEAGTLCDLDGTACTQDQCDGQGACVPVDTTDCSDAFSEAELGPCQVAQCASESGACQIVPVEDGLSCNTGDLCDAEGFCESGRCVAPPKDCSALNEGCVEGVCDPADGSCRPNLFPLGTPCDDGDVCTAAGRCVDVGAERVCQDALISEGEADLCDRCAGLNEGDVCDDGNACTVESNCVRRGSVLVCLGAVKRCERDSFAEELTACQQLLCDPVYGTCSIAQDLPTGSRCDDDLSCTRQDRCEVIEGELTCVGIDQQSALLDCPAGSSLLNPDRLAQTPQDLGLVDQCAASDAGQTALVAHQVSSLLAGDDRRGKILSNLDQDHSEEWFSVRLEARELVSLKLTDRCGQPLPLLLSIFNASGTRDLSSSQRARTVPLTTEIDLSVTETGNYLVRVDLARSLADGEAEVSYVLHIDRDRYDTCAEVTDCCAEEICTQLFDPAVGEDPEALYCQTLLTHESADNDLPSTASRLLFLGEGVESKQVGALSNRLESDWFKVRLQAQHVYDFTVQGYCGQPLDTILSLYSDPTRPPMMVNDDHTEGAGALLTGSSKIRGVISGESADYYLKVEGSVRGDEPYGSYVITAEDVSCTPNQTPSDCECAAQRCVALSGQDEVGQCVPRFAEREPNQDPSSARVSDNRALRDAPLSGQIERVGDQDTYLVRLPPGRFKIETSANCGQRAMNTALRVRNLSGITVAEDEDSGASQFAMIAELVVTGDEQEYQIEVRGTNGSTGGYLLEITTLSLGDSTGIETGLCQVDADCSCPDLRCEAQEDGPSECVARSLEIEPNELRFDATSLPFAERMTGRLASVSDLDLYRVTLSQDLLGEQVVFAVDTACEGRGVEAELRLLDARGVELAVGEAWREGYLVATSPFEVERSGDYYLEVSSPIAARGDYVITSKVVVIEEYVPLGQRSCFNDDQCQCAELRCNATTNNRGQCLAIGSRELEPNDTEEQARVLSVNEAMVGSITAALSSRDDVDQYLIDFGPEDLWRRFSLTVSDVCAQPTPPRVELQIYNPQGVLIFTAEGTEEAPPLLKYITVSTTGAYRVMVRYAAEATVSEHQTYRLEVGPAYDCSEGAGHQLEPGELCLCGDESCESLDEAQCLARESEPNSLISFPERLSAIDADYRGSRIYGRVDELGDRDFYTFTFSREQRGALFQVQVSPFCQQPELPLARAVLEAGSLDLILSEDAAGNPRGDSAWTPLGSGLIRAEAERPLLLDLNLTPLAGEEIPNTGEYRLEILPVECEVDADCLCPSVSCQEVVGFEGRRCRAQYDEREPNNERGDANAVTSDELADPSSMMVISGHLGGELVEENTLDISDFWRLPRVIPDPEFNFTLQVRPERFCEAPVAETRLALRVRSAADPNVYNPVSLVAQADETGSYYEAVLSHPEDYVLEVSGQEVGSYQFKMSITPIPVVVP